MLLEVGRAAGVAGKEELGELEEGLCAFETDRASKRDRICQPKTSICTLGCEHNGVFVLMIPSQLTHINTSHANSNQYGTDRNSWSVCGQKTHTSSQALPASA